LGGPISPKSVVATNTGLVFAQNMMYRHTVTVYNSAMHQVATISDGVNLSRFGVTGRPGITRGAPVEAAVTPDGQHVWISNYSMYGAGSGPESSDTCTPSSARAAGNTDSYLYRISTKTLAIDAVAPAGIVPKFLQVTPNGRYVVASNWCSWDLTVVDAATDRLVARLPIGPYPRGIAVSADSHYGYVAEMGSSVVAVVDLQAMKVVGHIYSGINVRHVVIDPRGGAYLYASLNAPGDVVKINRASGRVVATVHTGAGCRSLAISTDGTALFVVNYDSNTMTMLRASDLTILRNRCDGNSPRGHYLRRHHRTRLGRGLHR
jgi:YVTN family beta-propeller protein